MIINHNISALNTHRQMGANNNAVSQNLEKLSSGLKINRAGDDAAGLAISEKMRAQIRGLDMATKNAQDGISLIQTAEGALQETHSILQRMRELAVQSSSDTNMNEVDREAMQAELEALVTEINDISKRTEFNTQKLIDGSFEDKVFHIGANKGQNIEVTIANMDAEAIGVAIGEAGLEGTKTTDDITIGGDTVTGATVLQNDAGENIAVEVGGAWYAIDDVVIGDDPDNPGTDILIAVDGAEALGDPTETTVTMIGDTVVTQATGNIDIHGVTVDADTTDVYVDADGNAVAVDIGGDLHLVENVEDDSSNPGTLVLKSGVTNADAVDADDVTEISFAGDGISVANRASADAAIEVINDAINQVSTQRSALGAIQNRLEHTINNLGASSENLSAAEARIRDTDMAKEMMEFTKNNILTQAAQAMLAQANQVPQGVLQLLR